MDEIYIDKRPIQRFSSSLKKEPSFMDQKYREKEFQNHSIKWLMITKTFPELRT